MFYASARVNVQRHACHTAITHPRQSTTSPAFPSTAGFYASTTGGRIWPAQRKSLGTIKEAAGLARAGKDGGRRRSSSSSSSASTGGKWVEEGCPILGDRLPSVDPANASCAWHRPSMARPGVIPKQPERLVANARIVRLHDDCNRDEVRTNEFF